MIEVLEFAVTKDRLGAKETTAPPDLPGEGQMSAVRRHSVRIAKDLYRLRRMRARAFGDHAVLFGEPAWDILLNLYIAHGSGRQVSIRKAAMSGEVPQTTGLRLLVQLEARGLVFRVKDARDNRRSFVCLSDTALALLDECLPTIIDRTGHRAPVPQRSQGASEGPLQMSTIPEPADDPPRD